ncbi:conserved hypothetical protein [Ricinus communis]|uniref:RNase H type-1 domain-containing protein n=1 Tax=Ricinus communis TaxID=3988 RepID=B9RR14_RICCO|nr:conserved hypothetical protein [Ricinus communis]
MVYHGSIMCNVQRARRGFTSHSRCGFYGDEESVIHALRDCGLAKQVWEHLLSFNAFVSQSNLSVDDWVRFNLNPRSKFDGFEWNVVFAWSQWWIWKWRDVKAAFLIHSKVAIPSAAKELRHVSWIPPGEGWFKLNADGCCKQVRRIAGGGGIIRDSIGMGAELWAVLQGLILAWNNGFHKLLVEVDSAIVADWLSSKNKCNGIHSNMVLACLDILKRDWSASIGHIYREANQVADCLANLALSYPVGIHELPMVPYEVKTLVNEDCIGVGWPRVTAAVLLPFL